MSKINQDDEIAIKAKVLDHLIDHLQKRTDVQNIDLMNLSGFCRNCLSKWYSEYAKDMGYDLDYEESRKKVYGIPYSEWKDKFQLEATAEQLKKFKEKEKE